MLEANIPDFLTDISTQISVNILTHMSKTIYLFMFCRFPETGLMPIQEEGVVFFVIFINSQYKARSASFWSLGVAFYVFLFFIPQDKF